MSNKISIIIPTFNEEKIIEKTLAHTSHLSPSPEIIVVDGGSTDNTRDISGNYATVISSPPGRALQMNTGSKFATGDILLFLHADTTISPDSLHQILTALKDTSVIGGGFKLKLDTPGILFKSIEIGSNLRASLLKIFFGDQCLWMRKEIFQQIGGYPQIKLMEDWEISQKLKDQGKIVLLPGPALTSARRWIKNGVWKTIFLMHKIKLLYLFGVSPQKLHDMYYGPRVKTN